MFIDEAVVTFRAGKGGDGSVSWRREKYIPNGGPFGGDGGHGGNVILHATTNENTLSEFRHKKVVRAENGEKGATKEMHGRNGVDSVIELPVGTIVTDAETGEIIFDLSFDGQTEVLCTGGRGGFGNSHFATSTRQAPSFAEMGDEGQARKVKLELKLVADVGIIGLPNAGKSTFISAVTSVRPKIADYPFTTLIPNLGVMEYKGKSIVLEDVPGLIPGASEGKGLGIQFLKHIERTDVLLHLLDASGAWEDSAPVWQNYEDIRKELEAFSPELAVKEETIVFTKIDLLDDESVAILLAESKKKFPNKRFFAISAAGLLRLEELQDYLITTIEGRRKIVEEEEVKDVSEKIYDLKSRKEGDDHPKVHRIDRDTFEVTGVRLEQIVRMTDMKNIEAVARVYDILEKLNVLSKVLAAIERESGQEIRDSFFEGTPDVEVDPKIVIAGRVFPLEKTFFQKRKK